MIRVIHSVIIIKILVCYQFEPFSHSKRFRIHFAKSIPIQKLLTLKIWIHAYMWHIEYSLMRPCMYTSNLFHSVELGFKIVTLNSNVSKFKCIITKPFHKTVSFIINPAIKVRGFMHWEFRYFSLLSCLHGWNMTRDIRI